jgi:two-component system, OmpR family, sensor histidine kinase ChvG
MGCSKQLWAPRRFDRKRLEQYGAAVSLWALSAVYTRAGCNALLESFGSGILRRMPLDTDQSHTAKPVEQHRASTSLLAPLIGKARAFAEAGRLKATEHILPWLRRQTLWKFCTATLRRRIVAANIIGLVILLGGLGIFHRYYEQLIDAKVETLRTQAQMVAVAIASNAKVETDRIVIDPDRLPATEGARIPFRDDAFAALEMSLAPERIAPVLRRLVQNTNTRARVYSRERSLLVDTGAPTLRNIAANTGSDSAAADDDSDQRLRNFWTRFLAWFMRSELPVYRDLTAVKGPLYPEVREALDGKATRMLLVNSRSQQMVAVMVPIQVMKSVQGVVMLSTRPGEIDNLLFKERRALLIISALAIAATLLASLLLERTIAGPMRRLSDTAEQVSRSVTADHNLKDLSERRDEVGHLATSFQQMTAALYCRIEASDRFAMDVAHELKNPVAAARSTAESLVYAKTDAKRDELVSQIQGELKRLNRLISDVANASRLDAELARQEFEPVDLKGIVEGVISVLRDVNSDRGTQLSLTIEAAAEAKAFVVNGHEGRLSQVMTNLVDNALSFSAADATVSVTMRRDGSMVEILVDDQGPGIPEDKLDEIFKRFYSDRPQSDRVKGKNSGLGLSITREIVIAHGGTVDASNRKAGANDITPAGEVAELGERRQAGIAGARFRVRLPADKTRI